MVAVNIRLNPLGVVVIGVIVLCLGLYTFDVPNRFREAPHGKVNMKTLLAASIHLAEKGGERVYSIRKGAASEFGQKVKGETKEGAAEFVSQGDLQSHKAIVYGFKKAFPEFPTLQVVSEEHDEGKVDMRGIPEPVLSNIDLDKLLSDVADIETNVDDITIWVDPLDATQEYTENLLNYVTTMTCVAVKGKPLIGVIHLPFGDGTEGAKPETFWGWSGEGFQKYSPNLHPEAHQRAEDKPYSIIVSRSHTGDVGEVAKKALGENTEIVPAGGAGFKTLQVIKGANDAYVHTTTIKKWDICAGEAILNAVGGSQTTLAGDRIDYRYDGTNEKNTAGLLATLKQHKHFVDTLSPAFNEARKNPKIAAVQKTL